MFPVIESTEFRFCRVRRLLSDFGKVDNTRLLMEALQIKAEQKCPGQKPCVEKTGGSFTVDEKIGILYWYNDPDGSTGVISEKSLKQDPDFQHVFA